MTANFWDMVGATFLCLVGVSIFMFVWGAILALWVQLARVGWRWGKGIVR